MAGRLAAVPTRAVRVLGVVRVSKERDGTVSPEIQVTAITDYCRARGYQLVDVVEGLDQSGSQRRSAWWPTLDRAVGAVESGEYDGIVVWKFSRTARHRLKWAVALDRVESASGILESATEQFDTTTSAGRFARGMVAEMNAFEAERIGEVWQEAHDARVRAGRPHSGKERWGYLYDRGEKLHKPHPEQGPVLADLYRRYVAGESIGRLVRWLNAHGHRTVRGGQWTDSTLRKQLDSGFAAGLFLFRGQRHDGVHEPVIDQVLWQGYLDARVTRRKVPSRREGSPYLLSGLVRCARCGWVMVAFREDLTRRRKTPLKPGEPTVRLSWCCRRCPEVGVGPVGYVASWRVEAAVLAYAESVAAQVEEHPDAQVAADARRTLVEVEIQRLAREGARLDEALVRLAVSNAENPMPGPVYAASKAELEQRAGQVCDALEAAGAAVRRAPRDQAAQARGLLEQWDELPVEACREVLRSLLDCVLVATGPDPWLRVVEWGEVRG